MKRFFGAMRGVTVTYSTADIVAVALIAAVVATWAGVAGAAFSVGSLVACEAAFFAFYLAGSLVAGFRALATGVLFDLPLRLLAGYGVVNTALLVLAWLSPLGVVVNFCLVLAVLVLSLFATGARERRSGHQARLWAVALCLVATTLWCQDSIRPVSHEGDTVLFKPWIDGFYHAVHVRIFAESHGASSIEDFRMAGVPARPYHYGVYMLPAFVKQAAGIHSFTAFAGILVPVGTLFTGFAAYAFFGSCWGPWAGLGASAALLLLPDGAEQGMQNPFMSYHWLTQISPSATYGLALLAVAWLFVVQGCTRGSRTQLFCGWLVAAVVAVYKLHFVVACALLLLLLPALFFRARLRVRERALWAAGAVAVYALFLVFGQKVPGVPLIVFDGSATGEILRLIQTFARPGALKDQFVERTGAHAPWTSNLFFGIPYVLLAALGFLLPLLVVLVIRLRARVSLLHLLLPIVLVVNFLAMFFGLALDFSSSTPDELSHRPIMVVYFFVVSWIGGVVGSLLAASTLVNRPAKIACAVLAVALLAVPASFGPGVQRMWAMPRISPVRLPAGLVRAAEFLRSHGSSDDVFQDSQFDRAYAISALSERKSFISHTMTTMPYRGDMVAARTAAVDRLMGLEHGKLAVGTARAFGLRWFVLQRGNRVKWPPEMVKPVFQQGGFTIYEF
jgi:hypothetical protein